MLAAMLAELEQDSSTPLLVTPTTGETDWCDPSLAAVPGHQYGHHTPNHLPGNRVTSEVRFTIAFTFGVALRR